MHDNMIMDDFSSVCWLVKDNISNLEKNLNLKTCQEVESTLKTINKDAKGCPKTYMSVLSWHTKINLIFIFHPFARAYAGKRPEMR